MKLCVVYRPAIPASASPYRLVDDQGQEITWTNDFLDAQRIRQLSLRTVRSEKMNFHPCRANRRLERGLPTNPAAGGMLSGRLLANDRIRQRVG